MKYPFYFLSVSIESKPASCIGSFGLSITCLLAPFMAFIRYNYVIKVINESSSTDDNKTNNTESALKWNTRALKVATLTGIGGHGVASFQSKSENAECGDAKWIVGVHLLFAGLFFGGGLIYCLLTHHLDNLLPTLGTPKERMLRKIFAYLTCVQFIILMFVLPALYTATGGADFDEATGEAICSGGGGCTFIVVMSVFEITLLITFMSTYITFLDEFKNMELLLTVLHNDRVYSVSEREHSVMRQSKSALGVEREDDSNFT
jgi:hypothetical protein